MTTARETFVARFGEDQAQAVEAMKEWARGEGQLGQHDGHPPDYLALMAGAYEDWIYVDPEPGPDAARVVPEDAEVTE